MFLRSVTVTIAPGKTEAYWEWAKEIVDLWDSHHVTRAGGPYRWRAADGKEMALWLTVHENEDEIANEFRTLYAEGRGRELIEQRPPLVEHTDSAVFSEWDRAAGVAPAPPWGAA